MPYVNQIIKKKYILVNHLIVFTILSQAKFREKEERKKEEKRKFTSSQSFW